MKSNNLFPLLALLFLLLPANGNAAGSLVRVACDGDAIGAEISINGAFKGECPLDIQVGAGTLQLRMVKKVDNLRERVFEQEIRMGDGVVKKVEAVLSEPRLNPVAQKLEDDRLRVERAEAAKREEARQLLLAEERRQDELLLAQQQKDAAAGDSTAMVALGDRYASGKGVNKNEEEANAWYRKAAAVGNELAEFKLSALYKTGKKEDVDAILRLMQLPTGPERTVSVEGVEKIRAFVASDPFFEVPGGNQVVTFSYEKTNNDTTYYTSGTCGRESRFFQVDTKNGKWSGKSLGVLGGLIPLEAKSSSGLFDPSPSFSEKLVRIEKLRGQPFPLTAGERFVITYVTKSSGTEYPQLLTCAIDSEAAQTTGQQQITGTGQPLLCLTQYSFVSMVSRYSWHEASGCFVTTGDK